MIIEQLDSVRLLITLQAEDLHIFDLTPEQITMDRAESVMLIRQILSLALIKAGIRASQKSLSVETLPYSEGCFLLVTIKERAKSGRYRIKQSKSYSLLQTESADTLLSIIKHLYDFGAAYTSNLYRSESGRYYLLLISGQEITQRLKLLLSEYSLIIPCTRLTLSRLNETCTLLHGENAVDYIGSLL